MMKYNVDENPRHCLVQIIKLREGQEGTLTEVVIYGHTSFIRTLDGRYIDLSMVRGGVFPPTLSELPDSRLDLSSRVFGIPIEEIKEVRDIERAYRNSLSQETDSS